MSWLGLSDAKTGDSRNSTGVDGESINHFAQYTEENLEAVANLLGQRPGYAFSSLKAHLEPKPKGGIRVICVPTVRDRIVQRAILNYLSTTASGRYSFDSSVSYGFLKGKSTRDAINKAKELREQLPWAYKTDIASFFDAIDREILRKAIDRRIPHPTVRPLLYDALDCEVRPTTNSQKRQIIKAGLRKGRGVRQGMPLSPYFANLILSGFDRSVISAKLPMIRYADDLVFFASSQSDCESIHDFCVEALSLVGLTVHPVGTPGKTSISRPNQAVEFLGTELAPHGTGYRLEISQAQIDKRKAELLQYGSLSEMLEKRVTVSRFLRVVDAKIQGWSDAYRHCDNLERLTDTLHDCRKNVIETIVTKELGITSPTSAQRQFLELDALPPSRSRTSGTPTVGAKQRIKPSGLGADHT